ncbi:MAG: LTA synthase family protein [Eubacteriales bacterium]|nr:LTA synthase family protein [Eubacteriales bacterium]
MIKKILTWRAKSWWLNLLIVLAIPALAYCGVESYTSTPLGVSSTRILICNLIIYYLLYFTAAAILGNVSWGYTLVSIFCMGAGLANYYVLKFRSTPILPWDLMSLGTAAEVAGNYDYHLGKRVILILLGFLVLIVLSWKADVRLRSWKLRIPVAAAALCCLLLFAGGFQNKEFLSFFDIRLGTFRPRRTYAKNGTAAGFLYVLSFTRVDKPDGYSAEEAVAIAKETANEETQLEQTKKLVSDNKTPNVIVIMNEALSDFSFYGDIKSDVDTMPFIHALKENTVKGNAYVSIKGGNTADSEYEFLTGDTMAFLPAGSIPYQQFIKGEMPGLPSYFAKLGYETHAIHPYHAKGWLRNKVYPWMSFQTMTFEEGFEGADTIRDYITDQEAFRKIIEQYEAKQGPSFIFEVTMQNHSSYRRYVHDFDYTVRLTGYPNKTRDILATEEYLSLVHTSDEAFKELIEYFEKEEEDTIILMFGDHQPADFATKIGMQAAGVKDTNSDEAYCDGFVVPFVMWANYDIEEEEVDAISLNYLSGLLMEKAGIPLTGYQKFLAQVREEIPVITSTVIMDEQGERKVNDGSVNTELLTKYRKLMYNHLIDANNRIEGFFDS